MIKLKRNLAGSRESHEPRRVGDIIKEMFLCNSPLAKGYHKHLASNENMWRKEVSYG
jgi:hypothetical protein